MIQRVAPPPATIIRSRCLLKRLSSATNSSRLSICLAGSEMEKSPVRCTVGHAGSEVIGSEAEVALTSRHTSGVCKCRTDLRSERRGHHSGYLSISQPKPRVLKKLHLK
ncbi:hypothetical protein J6590_093557 [Homalodisca vitripennis]|nr:hypothetical protein J6590_093557 [Homalodisca vitripennis]